MDARLEGGPSAIRAEGLTKRYHGVAVVDRLDLTVMPGEVYGFLGPNGAGKTTTMRMMLGLVRRDEGRVRLFGHDPADDLQRALRGVAGIIEEPRLYPYLSGRRNLRLLAMLDRGGQGRAASPPLADNLGHTGVGFAMVVFSEVLAGKALALYSYVAFAMLAFFVVATGAAILAWGAHPLVGLSGQWISPLHALGLDLLALLVYLMPVLALASFGLFLSVVTRQSVAAVGGTVIYAMALQGVAVIAAIKAAHPYLLTNQLTAWHGLFQTPVGGGTIVRAAWVSAAFALPPLVAAFALFARRDVTT